MLEAFDRRRYLIPFRSLLLPHILCDTVVIGGGVAGMRAALAAADEGEGPQDVILLTKADLEASNTAWAQGGIACSAPDPDAVAGHVADTLAAGAGLCDQRIVQLMVEESSERLEELQRWGMRFDRDHRGQLEYGMEGGHHARRILHSGGAATGLELVRCLAERVQASPNIRVFDRCFALDLVSAPANVSGSGGAVPGGGGVIAGGGSTGGRVLGVVTHHPHYGLQIIWAKATILASGGAGQVYRETTNPRIATGDGPAMAHRAGAVLADLEFMQFHPTTLYVAGASRALISEAVRGEGAHLVDRAGRRFMHRFHEMAELAPRDVVSRAIVSILAEQTDAAVYLDARHLDAAAFARRFPNLITLLRTFDRDPATDLIPVHPSAHYFIGGVWTDMDGRTSLPGLYACGEAACNGVHGANRLASNSLLDGLVFGRRAGLATPEMREAPAGPMKIISDIATRDGGELDLVDVRSSLRSVMWRNVGIERTGAKLDDVIDMFDFWARYTLDAIFDEPDGWETQNLLTIGALITRAAQRRRESRGVHFRRDFPNTDNAQAVHVLWRAGDGEPRQTSAERPLEVAS